MPSKKSLSFGEGFREGVPMEGLEPPHLAASDPKSDVSTNFTTWALRGAKVNHLMEIFAVVVCCLSCTDSVKTIYYLLISQLSSMNHKQQSK